MVGFRKSRRPAFARTSPRRECRSALQFRHPDVSSSSVRWSSLWAPCFGTGHPSILFWIWSMDALRDTSTALLLKLDLPYFFDETVLLLLFSSNQTVLN